MTNEQSYFLLLTSYFNEFQTMNKQKVKFLTLGCRLNQYETQAMREDLLRGSYEETSGPEKADVYVINTCTVTSDADRTGRYLIRRCSRENPNAKIVVTGCYAERDHKTIAQMPGVTHIVLNREKSEIADLLTSCTRLSFDDFRLPSRSKAEYVPLQISEFSGKTRAHLKVQDGCNHACSFCKVVLVRGKSRSRALSEVAQEARRLSENGFKEIVLTGVQLGAYGLDFEPPRSLASLLGELVKIETLHQIRLSSIEPTDVTDELIDVMKQEPKICKHLHIPLQSGSREILKAMNRRYGSDFYVELVQKLRDSLDHFVLTADVMVGFPGEDDRHFNDTIEVILKSRPFKLHVFPYSPREGTRAFALGAVSGEMIRRRMEVLRQVEEKLRREIQEDYVNRIVTVLVEEKKGNGQIEGRMQNYIPVLVPANIDSEAGSFQRLRIRGIQDGMLVGETDFNLTENTDFNQRRP